MTQSEAATLCDTALLDAYTEARNKRDQYRNSYTKGQLSAIMSERMRTIKAEMNRRGLQSEA